MQLTQKLLQELFTYSDGLLVHKTTGEVFGKIYDSGYRVGRLCGKNYKNANLVYLYHKNILPNYCLDHKDRNKSNDKIDNLREATRTQNMWNVGSFGGRSAYKGVNYQKDKGKWRARYKDHGKRFHVGYYDTEEEAAKAYDVATAVLHQQYQLKNI